MADVVHIYIRPSPACRYFCTHDSELEHAAKVTAQDPSSKHRTTFSSAPELYHILLITTRFKNDSQSLVEQIRVCGAYTDLESAKDFSHRLLFDAGYEREWFTRYETKEAEFDAPRSHVADPEFRHGHVGLAVMAEAEDGTLFSVKIATTKNDGLHITRRDDDGRVENELYYVLQTTIFYNEDESGRVRENNVEGIFETEDAARKFAATVLLSEVDGIEKQSFASFDEVSPNERDCGYGEDIIVHAIGTNGENFLVSVLKGPGSGSGPGPGPSP